MVADNGELWVFDAVTGRSMGPPPAPLDAVDAHGEPTRTVQGVAAADGVLVVASDGGLLVFNAAGALMGSTHGVLADTTPGAMAIAGGRLFIYDSVKRVSVIALGGTITSTGSIVVGDGATGIAASAGELLVANCLTGSVTSYDHAVMTATDWTAGATPRSRVVARLHKPLGIALVPAHVVVAEPRRLVVMRLVRDKAAVRVQEVPIAVAVQPYVDGVFDQPRLGGVCEGEGGCAWVSVWSLEAQADGGSGALHVCSGRP